MGKSKFNENTRVQIPALVHLTRLGYKYFGKISESDANILYDPDTNILIEIFEKQFKKLNPQFKGDPKQILLELKQELNNDDLGQSFYKKLLSVEKKLIDFNDINNNVFHFTAEFTYKNGNEEFRPDITLFINGLPLVFIEVKKPNNKGGIIAESERMNNLRFPNKKFRRFMNITQLMIFSNNMDYSTNDDDNNSIEGSFYCTTSKNKSFFNHFREDPVNNNKYYFYENFPYLNIDPNTENKILNDFNCPELHNTPEYKDNLSKTTPTNRIITSMCSFERLLFLIKYGIAYINSTREKDGNIVTINQKHIMRYQQMFASLAIKQKLEEGKKSGVIWHTQGSGKTALSYYITKYLTDYFASKNYVAKFYFIVDRLDLLEQSKQEFEDRGLSVKTANSKQELMEQFRTTQSLQGTSGQLEITVVNIQRFYEDKRKIELPKYATKLQRIFIIDEAHRGYKPEGSFLSNLFNADTDSIKIALTGTPLLNEEKASWKIFGEYIHTYYYDKSIQDGYTLKIIREDIETSYKDKLTEIYDNLDVLVQKKDVKKSYIVEHDLYVKELTKYIINDMKNFRILHDDKTLGGMVICETSTQAKKMFEMFDKIQTEMNESSSNINKNDTNLKAGLILHDTDDKETRKQIINDFKKNMTIDILIVYNMLLTGFDAPRLKRLYFGRKLKDHNLLQAITRVNRPYKDCKYGFIIDFADIKKNFEETNAAYLEELGKFNDNNEITKTNAYDEVLENEDKLIAKVKKVNELLFNYTTDNLEDFSKEITNTEDKKELLELKNALKDARDCFNRVKTFGDDELKLKFSKMQINSLPQMISIVTNKIGIINQKSFFNNDNGLKLLFNDFLLQIEFNFSKNLEEELKITSEYDLNELNEKLKMIFLKLEKNIDPDDPEFIKIYDAFRIRFKEKGFSISTMQEYEDISKHLNESAQKIDKLQRNNDNLCKKYNGDVKFVRLHKRTNEENIKRKEKSLNYIISDKDTEIMEVFLNLKKEIDKMVFDNKHIIKKEAYFNQTIMSKITSTLKIKNIDINREDKFFILEKIKTEYLNQYNEIYKD
ncbi:type I restriction endonuclease subunit R [Mycoplasma zalophi]|uniref:type I restriction endonuclease subunit R n=1 Tax=Mycoplasma zalophi TaxID=191287 RepID=UPI001C10F427|nr:type I restriction endonuclease [Mycoplasma zalophi]MBU4690926.1 DEAD/DEAH box helicase family protein [Mycoplasma zalophi]